MKQLVNILENKFLIKKNINKKNDISKKDIDNFSLENNICYNNFLITMRPAIHTVDNYKEFNEKEKYDLFKKLTIILDDLETSKELHLIYLYPKKENKLTFFIIEDDNKEQVIGYLEWYVGKNNQFQYEDEETGDVIHDYKEIIKRIKAFL